MNSVFTFVNIFDLRESDGGVLLEVQMNNFDVSSLSP